MAAGAGIDFEENKDEETDANIDALEAYNATFDNAIVGDFFMADVWNNLVDKLMVSLPPEQKAYVIRNTNRSVHAAGILDLLRGTKTQFRILESQRAREKHAEQQFPGITFSNEIPIDQIESIEQEGSTQETGSRGQFSAPAPESRPSQSEFGQSLLR